MSGDPLIDFEHTPIEKTQDNTRKEMTKEAFDKFIGDFIRKKGNICKVDFGRAYNQLRTKCRRVTNTVTRRHFITLYPYQ